MLVVFALSAACHCVRGQQPTAGADAKRDLKPVRGGEANSPAQAAPVAPTPVSPAPAGPGSGEPDSKRDLKVIAKKGPTGPVMIPRSYAVVIGVANYQNPRFKLDFPNRDAEDIYAALISPEGGQFPAENVHKLVDERATAANIRHEIEEWLPSVTNENDRVLIYFAGHGFIDQGKGYLASYDVDLKHVPTTAYAMEDLGKAVGGKIKGKWKVLITDACHSGAITPESDRSQLNQSLLDVNKSLFSLTASRDREQSLESAEFGGGHGVFTYYVVKGMEGEADANGDGVVDADELGEYVRTNVRLATGARQNPTDDKGSFDSGMVLAYNASRVKANVPPPQYGNLVVEANMDNTEVWIDGRSAGVVNKATPLRLPGIQPGAHTIKGVHMGYEPDGPREEQVYPGQDTTVTIRILIARRASHAAVDEFDKGVEFYTNGGAENYRKAAARFERAIQIDAKFSRAYLYLGRVENALFEDEKAQAALKMAIEIDPDYLEARASYAAALLDAGNLDEAIRQLNTVTRREPERGMAWYLLSQAYARKEDYMDGKTAAEMAIKITPKNAEAHFWLAECLRHLKQPGGAETEYNSYLALSNFDTGKAGQLNYYLAGYLFGVGKKKRAAQTDIWKELRGQANLGLCDSEYMQKQLDPAIRDCKTALSYMPNDLFANYRLGMIYAEKFNQQNELGLLAAAKTHFGAAIAANPDANEADRARKMVKNIDVVLAQVR